MSDSDITRRTFLRGLGGTAVALPVLGSDLPEAAAAPDAKASSNGPFPKRLVVFYHPNGVLPSAWWPEPGETESDFDLGGPLEPLKPFRDRLLFLKGLEMKSPAAGPGGPHQQGMGGVLTGRPLQEGQMIGNDGSRAGWGDGISIDQAVAEEVGGGTPFKSLELGVRANSHGGSRVRTRLSYAGPAQPQPPQDDPTEVFDQLFSDGKTPPGSHDQIRQRRASILDTVQKQFDHVADRVSARDRRRLERHLSRVRNLETRLRKNGLSGENCKPPAKPADRDPDSEATM
ncbi:MAG: DUF1552 domain-containing protein, partial [Bradymonadaceae bacterium]